jgi:hypothetical protein
MRGRLFASLIVVGLVAACATAPDGPRLRATLDIPAQAELADVPFFAQVDYQCGPASLAMALAASGVAVRPEQLVEQVYSPAKQGSLPIGMISGARRHGRLAYPIATLDDLLREVAAGHPVIVLQRLGFPLVERWHYAVVIGYDLDRDELVLHSGTERRETMSLTAFARSWAPGGRWALLVLAPSALPVTARERVFLSAVLGLERTKQWSWAVDGYRTALTRWPDSLGALMGLGNSHYALGDLVSAERAFHQATRVDPNSAPAFNNLAHVLAEAGRRDEAIVAAERAVALAGPSAAVSKATLAEIRQALR